VTFASTQAVYAPSRNWLVTSTFPASRSFATVLCSLSAQGRARVAVKDMVTTALDRREGGQRLGPQNAHTDAAASLLAVGDDVAVPDIVPLQADHFALLQARTWSAVSEDTLSPRRRHCRKRPVRLVHGFARGTHHRRVSQHVVVAHAAAVASQDAGQAPVRGAVGAAV
jgi:hypothetical protein